MAWTVTRAHQPGFVGQDDGLPAVRRLGHYGDARCAEIMRKPLRTSV